MRPNGNGTGANWADSGPEPVAPGVHRIPLPLPTDGLAAVNVYVVRDAGELLLIDSGWAIAESRKRLVAGLAELGHDLGDVRRFLVTHVHRDHYSQSVILRREFGMRVALGIGEQPSLRATRGQGEALQAQIGQLRRAGADPVIAAIRALGLTPPDLEEWADPDEWLTDGQEIELSERRLTVLATPGHTQGHVVFADRTHKLLFAGDHILPRITPSIGFESGHPDARPLRDYLRSLAQMQSPGEFQLLPAHGPAGGATPRTLGVSILLGGCRSRVPCVP
jgi:glyoxylase-like metal-dependent hydrolase (beta-lactamase superfamily II)